MSYPYLSDLINHLFGTQWHIPIAMFGSFVAIAIITATFVGKKEVLRFDSLGILPKVGTSADQIVVDLVFFSVIFGIVGARIFHLLEYPQEFLNDPIGMIFSRSGLSIYGGLIFGVGVGAFLLKKRAIPIIPMLDALAPSMILGYGIGRIGCQISGDGDWGIASNMALKPNWLPEWFWSQTYENNILGVIIPSPGVYPTPIYESIIALCIFLFLWAIRKTEYKRGYIFSVYLLLSGFSRLLVEKIRINSEYHFLGGNFTQAEFISTVLILVGLFGILKSTRSSYIPKIAFSFVIFGVLSACAKL
jgi:phosphatidylglycerol:prolipoprotein diacylglycerol transferase